jgi:hypothetical protein
VPTSPGARCAAARAARRLPAQYRASCTQVRRAGPAAPRAPPSGRR